MLTHLMLEKVAITVDTVNVSQKSTIRMYMRQGSGGWGGVEVGAAQGLET